MYRCTSCKNVSAPGVRQVRVAAQTREVRHPAQRDAYTFRQNGKRVMRDNPGGRGTQIVREDGLCPACARLRAGE